MCPSDSKEYEYRQRKFHEQEVVTVIYIFVPALKGWIAFHAFGLKLGWIRIALYLSWQTGLDLTWQDITRVHTHTHTHTDTHTNTHTQLSAAKVMRHLETFQTRVFTLSLSLIQEKKNGLKSWEVNRLFSLLNINCSSSDVHNHLAELHYGKRWWIKRIVTFLTHLRMCYYQRKPPRLCNRSLWRNHILQYYYTKRFRQPAWCLLH